MQVKFLWISSFSFWTIIQFSFRNKQLAVFLPRIIHRELFAKEAIEWHMAMPSYIAAWAIRCRGLIGCREAGEWHAKLTSRLVQVLYVRLYISLGTYFIICYKLYSVCVYIVFYVSGMSFILIIYLCSLSQINDISICSL